MTPPMPDLILEPLVRAALIEDLGSHGDITTRTVTPQAPGLMAPSEPARGEPLQGCKWRPWPFA